MANTYSQVYLQYIFAVKGRGNLIPQKHNDELQKYITGIIQNRKQKLLAINNMPDHLHLLVGFGTTMSMSDFMEEVKSISSKFINDKAWIRGKFEWQRGYGVFSYSRSQIDDVIKYILNQQEHHKKRTFKEEYLEFLKKFEIDFDEKYLFEWIEEE
ncbi:MAG: IS200/IS605 family transposase [Bacteroidales bacterium]|nr:MAG: IS200/IS605 family transposase [Bacteroidales bacterium]